MAEQGFSSRNPFLRRDTAAGAIARKKEESKRSAGGSRGSSGGSGGRSRPAPSPSPPGVSGYEVIRDGQGMSTRELQPGDIPTKVVPTPPKPKKIAPPKPTPETGDRGVLTVLEGTESTVEGRTPYYTVPKDITPTEAVKEGVLASSIPVYYSPIGTTKGTYEESQLNIVAAKKASKAQEQLQEEAQALLKEKVDREEYGDLLGTTTREGTYFTLKPESIKELPSYSQFDESGYFKFDRGAELKKIRETEGSYFGSRNIKLSAGDLWTWTIQTGTGVVKFGGDILKEGGVKLLDAEGEPIERTGEAPLKKWYESTFLYEATKTPLAPTTTSFKYTDPSTWRSEGWEYIKEIPQRPAIGANIALATYIGGRAASGAAGLYSAERAAGASRWAASGTLFGETFSGFSPIKIKSGIIGTSFSRGKPTQFGDTTQDFLKVGGKGGKEFYVASGKSTFYTPTEFKWGSIKYGWTGVTPKISSISGFDAQVVTLGKNIFTTTKSGSNTFIEGLGDRNILNVRNIPVQTSRYGFDFVKQQSVSRELFKGWGEALPLGKGGITLGESTFYFTPDVTSTYTKGYFSGGKFIRPTFRSKLDIPTLTDVRGYSLGKSGKGYIVPGARVVPGDYFSMAGDKTNVLFSSAKTRIFYPAKDVFAPTGKGAFSGTAKPKPKPTPTSFNKIKDVFKLTTTGTTTGTQPITTTVSSPKTFAGTTTQIFQPKPIQVAAPRFVFAPATTTSSLLGTLSTVGTRQLPMSVDATKMGSGFLDATVTLSAQVQESATATTTTTKTGTRTAPKTTTIITQPVLTPIPTPPRTPATRLTTARTQPGKIPMFKFPKFSGTASRPKTQGYIPQAKSGKKWVSLSKNPLTRSSALSRGARAVDNTTSSQFRIVKRGGKVNPSMDNYFGANQFKFRPYKIKKGKGIKMTNQYIEKRSSRIDTPGEKRGLKVAKWKKQTGGNWLV